MEINIKTDPKPQNLYTVKIDNKFIIQTTLVQQGLHQHADEAMVKEWVREIKKIYRKDKNQNLIFGLAADGGIRFDNKPSRPQYSLFNFIQICIGNHCLIYEPRPCGGNQNSDKQKNCKELRDLLADKQTTVVGIAMEIIAKKLEKEYGLKPPGESISFGRFILESSILNTSDFIKKVNNDTAILAKIIEFIN